MAMRKTPEEIEREIAETRARASDTLSALEQRLSLNHLLRQGAQHLQENSSAAQMARNLRDSVVANPWPALLALAGIGWMIWDSARYDRTIEAARREQARRRMGLDGADGAHQVPLARATRGEPEQPAPTPDQLLGERHAAPAARDAAEVFLKRGAQPRAAANTADTFAAAAGAKPRSASDEPREPRLD